MDDKPVAVITGGTSGIGKAVAIAFLNAGYRVAVCGRSEEKLSCIRRECASLPLLALRVDVTDISALESFADEVVGRWGKIKVWVNNAGISEPMAFTKTTEEAFDRMLAVNFKSVFFGSAIASRHISENGGVIINTSSFTSIIPTAGKALYGAIKAAVDNFTRSAAAELASKNIRVVSVIPGYVQTEMTEANISENKEWLLSGIALNRLSVPGDLTGIYVFLASPEASYITGVSIPVTGGKFCVQNPTWSWQ
jgi:NAD(P)-dependent dehydrogenase (short-subunit alcohol dehydrogenase family)